MLTDPSERTKVFISYSHRNREWLARLRVHLKPLEQEYEFDFWDDTKIVAGSKWREEIGKALRSAKAAVLLVSADFLASDFIVTEELPVLLRAAEEDGAIILPLILSPSRFLMTKGVNRFQALNDPSKPLISLTTAEQEAVFVKLTEVIEISLASANDTSRDILRREIGSQTTDNKEGVIMPMPQAYSTPDRTRRPITFRSAALVVLIAALAILTAAYWLFRDRSNIPNNAVSVLAAPTPNINVLDAGLKSDDPHFDNTPKFNELLNRIGQVRTLYFPSGAYYFNTRPNVITTGLVIIGDGVNSTSFIRNYTAINYDEALIHTQRTITIERVGILAAAGTSHGGAIRLQGQFASSSELRSLYITGQTGGTFDIPLRLDSNDNIGIRGCRLENVKLFAATVHLAWFFNVRGLTATDFDAYPAGGTKNHVTVQGLNPAVRSENVQIRTSHLVTLYVYVSNNISIESPGTEVLPDRLSKGITSNGKTLQ